MELKNVISPFLLVFSISKGKHSMNRYYECSSYQEALDGLNAFKEDGTIIKAIEWGCIEIQKYAEDGGCYFGIARHVVKN